MANKSLGRGLSALFGEENLDPAVPPTSAEPIRPKNGFRNLPLRRIEPNRAQPRRSFDEKALQELENSIRADYGSAGRQWILSDCSWRTPLACGTPRRLGYHSGNGH